MNGKIRYTLKEGVDKMSKKRSPKGKTAGLALYHEGVHVSVNKAKNGVEVRFDRHPGMENIKAMQDRGFRWSWTAKCWYARLDEHSETYARNIKIEGH
jgi:hypothetical protein